MSNKVEPIDTLAEALRRSCALFSQLVNDNAKLCNLESLARQTRPPIRRIEGTTQPLTTDEATAYDETEIIGKSIAIHEVEDDFRTAIQDTKRAIKHPSLAGTIEPIVDKPARWLAELLGEINSLELAAVYPPNALAPEQRMAALFAVLQRLDLLACSQEIGLQTTPDGTKQQTCGDKPVLTIHVADLTATFGTTQRKFDQSRQWDALKKLALHPGSAVRMSAAQASRLRKILTPELEVVAKAIYCVHTGRYAIRTTDFSVKIEPPQAVEN